MNGGAVSHPAPGVGSATPRPGDAIDTGPVTQFAKDILTYAPASILPAIFALIGATAFTRIFSPAHYGLYSLVVAITAPLTLTLTEWIAQPAARFHAEYDRESRHFDFQQIIALLLAFVTALALGLAVLVIAILHLFDPGGLEQMVVMAAIALVGVQILTSVLLAVVSARLRPRAYRLATVATSGLSIGLALVLIHVLGADVSWILGGQAIATACMLPYVYRASGMHLIASFRRPGPAVQQGIRRFARYGIPMMLWFVAAGILNAEDRYVIQIFRGSTEVGIYSVNYGLIAGLSGLLNAPVIMAVGPILYHQWRVRACDRARRTIAHMTELYMVLGLAFLGGVIVLGQPLVEVVLGARFREGWVILLPVALGRVIWGASIIGHKSLELRECTLSIAGSALTAAIVNLCLNVALVPRYGYIAAAWITAASYALYAMLIWWQARRLIPWDLNLTGLKRYVPPLLAATMGAHLWVQWTNGSLVHVLGGSSVFSLIYASLVILLARTRLCALLRPQVSL